MVPNQKTSTTPFLDRGLTVQNRLTPLTPLKVQNRLTPFLAFIFLIVWLGTLSTVLAQDDISLKQIEPGDSTFRRMRGNAYVYALEEEIDTANLPYVGLIEGRVPDRPHALRDLIGAMMLEAKRKGGNAFRDSRYFYEKETGDHTLRMKVFLISDSLAKVNQGLKPKGKITVISTFYKGKLHFRDDELDLEPESCHSVSLKPGEKIQFWTSGCAKKHSVKQETVVTRNRYFMTQPAKTDGSMLLPGVIGGAIGGVIVIAPTGGPEEIELVEVSDNIGSILMKAYKRTVPE
jgi:hypothetical protein